MSRAEMSNLAVVWKEVGKVTVQSVPVPEPAPHEVVVNVHDRSAGLRQWSSFEEGFDHCRH